MAPQSRSSLIAIAPPESTPDAPPAEAGGPVRVGSSLVRLDVAGASATLAPPPVGDDVPTIVGPSRRNPSGALALAPGFKLGHYEVIDALGSGGMATVLKARDTELGRIVALKILPPESARDPDSVTRFKQEARAAAKLDHDNVARVFFCGEEKGLHFIAFEFVEGETLKELIDRRGTLDPGDCLRYLLQLAAGLQHASDRGVIHRDVKPSNIVITPDGKAKLIDMGLARQQGLHSVNGGVTQSGMTLGTFDYISPEQALDPRTVDVRSDIYSLGCAFYHALTGRPPVPEGTAARKLHAHQHEPPIDPRQLNPRVPDALAVILSGMMVKDPARRYASPDAMIRDLLAAAESLGIPTDPTIVSAMPLRSESSRIRALTGRERPPYHWAVLAGGGVASAAVAILVLALGGRSGQGTVPTLWDGTPPTRMGGFLELPTPDRTLPVPPGRKILRPVTASELLAAFAEADVTIQLAPGQLYDLSATAGAVFAGREIVLESQNPALPATVRIASVPVAPENPSAFREGALTITGATVVRIHGLRFEIAQKGGAEESLSPPVGLVLDDAKRIEIAQCQFALHAATTSAEGVGVLVSRSGRIGDTDLAVGHTTFALRRWCGLEIGGAVKADFTECGFAGSSAGLRLVEGGASPSVSLRFCTFLIENRGSAVEARGNIAAAVRAGFSVFASGNTDPPSMMMPEPEERKPALIRAAPRAAVSASAIAGQPNAFYRVEIPAGWDSPIDLKQNPWATAKPAALLDTVEPWRAFELDARVKSLRVSSPPEVKILGVKRLPTDGAKIYGTWPPGGTQPDALPPGVKVWYPNPPAAEKDSLPDNVFDDLAQAMAKLKPNDTLWIRGAGVIVVPKLAALARPDFRVTIRPEDERETVILTPAEPDRLASAMFLLNEGEMRFERIEFRLKPTLTKAGDLKSQAIVAMAGGRSCEFHQCVITMEQQKDEVLTAVSLVDDSAQMRNPEQVRRPSIRMENCILRGRGRAVWAQNAIPFDLTASNVLVASAAPFVDSEAPLKPTPAGPVAVLQLSHVTAWLGGGLLEMHCGKAIDEKPAPFVPVEIRTDNCLFVHPESGAAPAPFALVSGGDPSQWDRYLTWTATGESVYSNFPKTGTVMMEVTSDEPAVKAKRLDIAGWLTHTMEKPTAFGPVEFARPPDNPAALAQIRPEDAVITKSDFPAPIGCRIKSLPKPRR